MESYRWDMFVLITNVYFEIDVYFRIMEFFDVFVLDFYVDKF